MFVINCPSCPHIIVLDSPTDRQPPWCPRCGSDLKPRSVPTQAAADAASKRWNEAFAPSDAVTGAPTSDVTTTVEPPPLPVHVPDARLQPRLMPDPLPVPSSKTPVPPWALVFALVCGIIPLMTLGGAIPTALGLGGASGCVTVARNSQMDLGTRLAICAAITVGCWVALFAIVGGVTMM